MQVRAAFYVFLSVQNLIAISAAWARFADVFSPEAASRLFGFVAAGATIGQVRTILRGHRRDTTNNLLAG